MTSVDLPRVLSSVVHSVTSVSSTTLGSGSCRHLCIPGKGTGPEGQGKELKKRAEDYKGWSATVRSPKDPALSIFSLVKPSVLWCRWGREGGISGTLLSGLSYYLGFRDLLLFFMVVFWS